VDSSARVRKNKWLYHPTEEVGVVENVPSHQTIEFKVLHLKEERKGGVPDRN